MKITERDIFNFVFYPELVKEEIKAFLDTVKNSSNAIEFYKELKSELENSISKDIKKKIADKIKSYLPIDIIELHPLREPEIKKENGSRLAAASITELKPKMTTKTFVDNEKEYLIKVLNYGETTKVFVFSTKDEVVRDFDIVIEPHNLKYHLEDNSEPLKIERSIEPEKIQLQLS